MKLLTPSLRRSWKVYDWIFLALLLIAGIWTTRVALLEMWRIGMGREEQSYILLAPLVAAWLFWLRRSRLPSMRVEFNLIGPAIIFIGWLANDLGLQWDIEIASHTGAMLVLLGCVMSMTGIGIVRKFSPALLALFFLIPIPGSIRQLIALPLQDIATNVTQIVLELIGVPAIRLGQVLVINNEPVAVGEACSGLRMILAFGVVVYAFAFSMPLRMSTRIVLLGISPLVAVLCNIVRLIPTSVFFGYGSVDQAQIFHDLAGWVMIPIALVMLVGILRLIRWLELPVMAFRLAMR